ncbi:MAG: hypothetical protein H7Y42_08205 [Chitinophagaceae bacterium]|nr:hypothetical protein [Chitinophagaceae bacterium]
MEAFFFLFALPVTLFFLTLMVVGVVYLFLGISRIARGRKEGSAIKTSSGYKSVLIALFAIGIIFLAWYLTIQIIYT